MLGRRLGINYCLYWQGNNLSGLQPEKPAACTRGEVEMEANKGRLPALDSGNQRPAGGRRRARSRAYDLPAAQRRRAPPPGRVSAPTAVGEEGVEPCVAGHSACPIAQWSVRMGRDAPSVRLSGPLRLQGQPSWTLWLPSALGSRSSRACGRRGRACSDRARVSSRVCAGLEPPSVHQSDQCKKALPFTRAPMALRPPGVPGPEVTLPVHIGPPPQGRPSRT